MPRVDGGANGGNGGDIERFRERLIIAQTFILIVRELSDDNACHLAHRSFNS